MQLCGSAAAALIRSETVESRRVNVLQTDREVPVLQPSIQ